MRKTHQRSSFAQTVMETRLRRGCSIRQMAEAAGVSFSAWARCERGMGNPSPHTMLRLRAWLAQRPLSEPCQCRRCRPPALPMGWQCPLCRSVYAPSVLECAKCNKQGRRNYGSV